MANTYWVVPGRFAAGEYPGAWDPKDAAARLRTLLGAGLDCFIDLTKRHEGLEPYAGTAAREAGRLGREVVHDRHAIVDMGLPRSAEETAAILDAIDNALEDGKSVYVHCWGGIGRTGTVVGCWFVRHGMTGDEALAEIAQRWQGMEKRYRHPRSPQTAPQRAYVRNWTEPSPGAAA